MTTAKDIQSSLCPNGHPRTPENLYSPPGRSPTCRACNKLAAAKYKAKKYGRPKRIAASSFPTALSDLFAYSEKSPTKLIWLFTTGHWSQAGGTAGSLNKRGYYIIRHRGKNLVCHRVIWELHNGPIPDGMLIDHINGIKTDNRIDNLRLATKAQNGQNQRIQRSNTTGIKGLTFSNRVWQGQIRRNGERYGFASKDRDEVEAWLIETREQLHGEFARHG